MTEAVQGALFTRQEQVAGGCEQCGRDFNPSRNGQRFCKRQACRRSRQAQAQRRYKERRGLTYDRQEACSHCGRKLTEGRADKKYCSDGCQRRAAELRHQARLAERRGDRVCQYFRCENIIPKEDPFSLYCGNSCRASACRYRRNPPRVVACSQCGLRFEASHKYRSGLCVTCRALQYRRGDTARCRDCSEPFKMNAPTQAFCRACRKKRRADRQYAKDLFKKRNSPDTCPYCQIDISAGGAHVDHITPLVRGGTNDQDNLQYLCAFCNFAKRDRTSEEYVADLAARIEGWVSYLRQSPQKQSTPPSPTSANGNGR